MHVSPATSPPVPVWSSDEDAARQVHIVVAAIGFGAGLITILVSLGERLGWKDQIGILIAILTGSALVYIPRLRQLLHAGPA